MGSNRSTMETCSIQRRAQKARFCVVEVRVYNFHFHPPASVIQQLVCGFVWACNAEETDYSGKARYDNIIEHRPNEFKTIEQRILG